MSRNNNERTPRWFIFVLLLMLLPLLLYPAVWGRVATRELPGLEFEMIKPLMYLLPLYVALSQWLSYKTYPERRTVAWLLQAMLLITYLLCLWLLHYAAII